MKTSRKTAHDHSAWIRFRRNRGTTRKTPRSGRGAGDPQSTSAAGSPRVSRKAVRRRGYPGGLSAEQGSIRRRSTHSDHVAEPAARTCFASTTSARRGRARRALPESVDQAVPADRHVRAICCTRIGRARPSGSRAGRVCRGDASIWPPIRPGIGTSPAAGRRPPLNPPAISTPLSKQGSGGSSTRRGPLLVSRDRLLHSTPTTPPRRSPTANTGSPTAERDSPMGVFFRRGSWAPHGYIKAAIRDVQFHRRQPAGKYARLAADSRAAVPPAAA